MKTSKEFTVNLKNGILTSTMLGEVIYSYNKRAKNMRDKEHEWASFSRYNRYFIDKYHTEDKYLSKKNEYYSKKDQLLQFAKPSEIHKVKRVNRRKIFDWQKNYNPSENDDVYYFYDRKGDYHEFYYVENEIIEYYLYFKVGNFSFHHPISEEEVKTRDLPIRELNDLVTEGANVDDLLSVQFCDKVLNGLTSSSLQLVA